MTRPKSYTKMTESGIQVQQQLIGGGGGGSKKALLAKIKKLFVKPKVIKSSESLTRAGKDLKLKKSESLQNQKPDKSPKSSDWDAAIYKQPRGHGKPMGPRAINKLELKYFTATKASAKRQSIKRGEKQPFKIKPK